MKLSHRRFTPFFFLLFSLLASASASTPRPEELLKNSFTELIAKSGLDQDGEADFRAALYASPDWQYEFLDSGPIANPEASLRTLSELWKVDPELAAEPIDRAMATALALQGPVRDWEQDYITARYFF